MWFFCTSTLVCGVSKMFLTLPPQFSHLPIPTHQPTLPCHRTATNWEESRLTWFLWGVWRHPTTSFWTAVSQSSVKHSKVSAIYPLLHTWAQSYPWMASAAVIDRGEKACRPDYGWLWYWWCENFLLLHSGKYVNKIIMTSLVSCYK